MTKRLFVLLTTIFLFGLQLLAQSPISQYGIGLLSSPNNYLSSGMGHSSIALANPQLINTCNPASYATRDTLSFVFAFGTTGQSALYKTANGSTSNNNGNISFLGMGFRITKWWGTSAGLTPFSESNYDIQGTRNIENVGDVIFYNNGSGGLSKAYLGNAINIGNHLTIGANANFLFGYVNHYNSLQMPNQENYYNAYSRNHLRLHSFYFDYGLQYTGTVKDQFNYKLGLTFAQKQSLSSDANYLATKTNFINNKNLLDTILFVDTTGNLLELPNMIGVGFAIQNNQWLFTADMTLQQWHEIQLSFITHETFIDKISYHIGGQYIPNKNDFSHYSRRIAYRLGAYFNNSYFTINNEPIYRVGTTFGVGLPLRKTKTSINISFDIGKYGSISKNGIESYYGILSLNLNLQDIWFVKPKFE